MSFCPDCGARITKRWIESDRRERLSCTACGRIQYQNPRVLVTCIVEYQNRALLCRRAHNPGRGLWAPPGGFVEQGETLEQAIMRETLEETGVVLNESKIDLHIVSSLHWISEIYVAFRSRVEDPAISIGPESMDARYFSFDEIPWGDLAFVELADYIRLYFRELNSGHFGIHTTHVSETGGHRREYRIAGTKDIHVREPLISRDIPPRSIDTGSVD